MKKLKNAVNKTETIKAADVKPQLVNPEPVKILKPKVAASTVGRVSFELIKPEARNVCVAGSFNDWKPEMAPLAPAGNGRWVGDLSLKPGRHEYLFVVDGQWMTDPNAKESVQNPFGGRNSILGVSE
jgi:1,4-alpha-glucan branching enzyme